MSLLKSRSKKRVSSNPRYKTLKKSLDYLISKRDDTKVSLNMTKVKKEDEENEKITKELKLDEENQNIIITNYEESRDKSKLKKSDMKHWQEDFKKRKEEWEKTLKKDVGLEEALFIAEDLVRLNKGQKLSMVK